MPYSTTQDIAREVLYGILESISLGKFLEA
jgi:hypothetical protein